MKTQLISIILLFGSAAGVYAAGKVLQSPISTDQLNAKLSAAGYSVAGEVELEDGAYSVDARDASGRWLEVHVDAQTGEILSPQQPGQIALSMDDVRARLAQAGYSDVRELERDDGFWNADARNANGQSRELRVHPLTGVVTDLGYDD